MTSTNDYLFDYQFGDWLAEYRILASTLCSPPDIVHALYADGQLNELLRWRRYLRGGLVASFHSANIYRAAQRFERFQTFAPKLIDAAIVVSSSQVQPFEKWFGRGKVIYVPHGIDVERFCPSDRQVERDRLSLLTVGDHMRDWLVLRTVIDEVNRRGLPVDFQIVTFERNFAYLAGCTHTTVYANISEQALIDLYRNSDAAFLPFKEATANNAVLEALACGTPVISTSIGGVPDYVNDKSGWLFAKGDVSSILGLIEAMSRNRVIAGSPRKEARSRALQFSWPLIGRRLLKVYAAIKNGQPLLEPAGRP
jgi:glycosyltransferase involved in cell wall biosynthesis